MKKVGVCEEEKRFSYFKYYEQPLAQIPQEKIDIFNAEPADPKAGLSIDDKNKFLKGDMEGYCRCGYGVRDDGTAFVCNTTYMPGVRCEMLDWWYPWHSVGSDLRYKIWDPEDHYFARADRIDYVCDSTIPMNQKTWDVNHYVYEDIGLGAEYLKICFKNPKDFGYDTSIIGTENCTSMVCAIGESSCAAAVTHKWHPYKDGVLFESIFWIGFKWEDGKIVKAIPDGIQIPVMVPKALYAHTIKEYSNLAAILPKVYAEEKDLF